MKGMLFFVIGIIIVLFLFKGLFSGGGNGSLASSVTTPPPSKVNVTVTEAYVFHNPYPSLADIEREKSCNDTCTREANRQQEDLNRYLEKGYVIINKMPQDTYGQGTYCTCKGQLYVLEK